MSGMMNGSKNFYRLFFKASTLTELLVVIIVSGILFIAVFDGSDIVKKYAGRLSEDMGERLDILRSHCTLELLCRRADSVVEKDGRYNIFDRGETLAVFGDEKKCLSLYFERKCDTIFRSLKEVRAVFGDERKRRLDTLYVTLRIGRDTVVLGYGIGRPLIFKSVMEQDDGER